MRILDVTGKKCPLPLIETKKALKELPQDEVLKVITDDETAKKNITRFLSDNDIIAEWQKNEKNYEIMINFREMDLEQAQPEAYCNGGEPEDKGFVIAFTKNYLGEGSEELGRILINGYIDTLIANDKLPQKMVFFNSGVFMTLKGSPQLEMIRELEGAGVEILVCGTCLDFYKKTGELAVGKVSNMYEILDSMINAGKVLNI